MTATDTAAESSGTMDVAEQNNESPKQEVTVKERIGLYDNFRGLAVIAYVVAMMSNLRKLFELPFWFIHTHPSAAEREGQRLLEFFNITIADLGPVMFYFLIGLTCVLAFQRRKEKVGLKAAYMHVFYRNLAVIGISCIMLFMFNAFNNLGKPEVEHGAYYDWNQLTSIGLVGIMMMPFLNKKTLTRGIAGVVILIVFQLLIPYIGFLYGADRAEGGIAACFGFLGVTLLITVMADLHRKNWKHFAIATGVVTVIAVILAWLLKAQYRQFNITYQFIALAAMSIIFLGYFLLDHFVIKKPIPFISWMGKNMLLYYVILQIARVVLRSLIPPVSVVGMLAVDLGVVALFAGIAWLLNKKNIIIKL